MQTERGARWGVAAAAVAVVALYVGLTAFGSGVGFPLDDGWIHQTYARSLARSGRWEYVPGVVSAGSTAPLWTLLLAFGYLLPLPPLLWAYGLGGLCLVWLGWSGMAVWRLLWPAWQAQAWAVGLSLALSWPLIWAAASGMETLFFAALGLTIVARFLRLARAERPLAGGRERLLLGLLCGLLILTRPDGVVLIGLVAAGLAAAPAPWRERMRGLAIWLLAVGVPLLPYFIFNVRASGTIWPNTLYAKQAEYAVELARPFAARLGQLLYLSLGGGDSGWRGVSAAHWLLLPGVAIAGWRLLRADWAARRLWQSVPLLWAGGHVMLYAWRLPVTYQHGRYVMAAVPAWILLGAAGWLWLLARAGNARAARLGRQVAVGSYWGLLLLFLLLGAGAYQTDVAFIEGEMVTVAHWLNENTPPRALIAAHDIGAIGYFTERPLLDLAGLVSPEIIPLLADEAALGRYILASDAAFLVTAPGWPYRQITAGEGVRRVFQVDYAWTREQGRNNTAVYRLPER